VSGELHGLLLPLASPEKEAPNRVSHELIPTSTHKTQERRRTKTSSIPFVAVVSREEEEAAEEADRVLLSTDEEVQSNSVCKEGEFDFKSYFKSSSVASLLDRPRIRPTPIQRCPSTQRRGEQRSLSECGHRCVSSGLFSHGAACMKRASECTCGAQRTTNSGRVQNCNYE
jgi:hypothetical protein